MNSAVLQGLESDDGNKLQAAKPPAAIRRRNKAERNAGFEALRAQGLALLQKTSGATWTDHNLHDPGMTMLEQLCFALTEVVYRSEFPVADQLCGADGEIDYEALALHPPQQAFPCRATTAADYRRMLLDKVSGLDDAGLLLDAGPGQAGHIPGVCQLMVKLAAGPRQLPDNRLKDALAAYRSQRGLGEDADPSVVQITDRHCQLHADIEISGPRDATDIVAEMFLRAARFIAQSVRVSSRRDLLRQGLQLEQIYDGPVATGGFAHANATDAHNGAPQTTLYVADVVREVAAVEGIKEVSLLQLETADDGPTSGSLPWRDGGQMLRLFTPGEPATGSASSACADLPLPRITVRRRSHTVPVFGHELWRRVQALMAADRADRSRHSTLTQQDESHGLPRGRHRDATPYHSVQHHFPAVYHVGRNGLPPSAPAQQLAPPRQLRSYLLLFEQVVANGQAQLQNLHQLFRQPDATQQTYWWQPLGEHNVPGLDGLCDGTPEQLTRQAFAPLDSAAARKSRRLDHLLALHGETYRQNTMRQFCGHLHADELDAFLLANKAAYLKDVITLSRDRAGGFDYGRPLWDQPENTSGLARRTCLLLGFRHAHARSLTAKLQRVRSLFINAEPPVNDRLAATALQSYGTVAIGPAPALASEREGHLRTLLLRPQAPLSAALMRCGMSSERYRVQLRDAAGRATLALGPDENQNAWRLGEFQTAALAQAAASTLRHYLLQANELSEGLHLVEHVLLRPLRAGATPPPPHDALKLQPSYYGLRLTAVLPDWTARTHQAGFQVLAEETLRINCPPHLSLRLRWLNFEDMARFEADYQAWLNLRRQHCDTPTEGLARRVDDAALRVITWLPAPPAAVPDFSDVVGSASPATNEADHEG